MVILDGKATADSIKAEIAAEVEKIIESGGKRPHLAAILVGSDGASMTYVGHKESACKRVGFDSTVIRLDETISQNDLLEEIEKINNNSSVDGLIVQLPLPKHIDEQKVIESIDPKKDVDGFHPVNVGKMVLGLPSFISATPAGILELLIRYGVETSGKHCVIIGRSNIVGKPMANLLSLKANPGDCTVTMCHSRTKNLKEHTLNADIIIAALGVPGFLKGDMVKEGAVVIDVGITRVEADTKTGFRLAGDVLFDEVAPKCSYITPVPGGVGPMTIISLLKNTLKASLLK
ncbi:MAG: bifunctional 5,10-methylene-tetrahydrofolate dehydrogenase/5,10-methylene-tetrahydrofolate cyclohydrolase [Bacteroidetes bacterium GWE2_39_28]|nr:MAG: bifunctional 5,10-methylene-tetrahydrofolate dehydrogenase/5,10-methylene-tetrahydrofolate cyclohydrolase [Bacteroidetes bacterium GWE2_39_28]OFY15230.1 MAG: bifunctional 5,10-methylene-tetrahydrofolate dehydrogenase/5,10-methylene-tetrahydrofolate cyclohydrolase [Bacteroidetes bacterium GWF2_39_10]OFZ09230.1 MAG: bifunctional 5,10-methylene-tetrahydrofolate dehydrogenase/5,10-methylene-tetrahydrofolate cyclohydrolase [Bacteroidetes bacterium RIFOXYB2_FULL_39_7]OFZ12180.1 MAG: bifunction